MARRCGRPGRHRQIYLTLPKAAGEPGNPWFGKDIRQGINLAIENYALLHKLRGTDHVTVFPDQISLAAS
ncbi:hypothetical protein ACFXKC_51990 [Streptomyces sp. NPDC059340]|uniref:hypothetical protein n=1 Tax=Streptomyces sp. NPDC059340 TaxID=3346806 RepID=UPI0036BC4A09